MEEAVIQINDAITINIDVSVKNVVYVKKITLENGKYFADIIDDPVITCDEIIESYNEETETVPTNFNEKKQLAKHKIFIFYLHYH